MSVLTGWAAPTAEEEVAARGVPRASGGARRRDAARECVPGHLTATTAVLSHDGARVLLTLHPKAGMWLPMGGHCEPRDRTLTEVALREAVEESGIAGLELLPGPLALDKHRVWCHPPHSRHLDVEYAAVAPVDAEAVISDESLDLRWFPIEEIPELSDEATRRLARRGQARRTLAAASALRARKTAWTLVHRGACGGVGGQSTSAAPSVSPVRRQRMCAAARTRRAFPRHADLAGRGAVRGLGRGQGWRGWSAGR